jgi:hypothetical protein
MVRPQPMTISIRGRDAEWENLKLGKLKAEMGSLEWTVDCGLWTVDCGE